MFFGSCISEFGSGRLCLWVDGASFNDISFTFFAFALFLTAPGPACNWSYWALDFLTIPLVLLLCSPFSEPLCLRKLFRA